MAQLEDLENGNYHFSFKLAVLVERMRATAMIVRSILLQQVLVGRYATREEVLEQGDDVCSICQEVMACPIALDECGHLFCEHCILSWCERSTAPTCPLCRTPVVTAAGMNAEHDTTTLLPQLF